MKTVDNPHLPPDFIERLKANYDPSLLKAYLDGEFVNLNTGQVYDRFDREHVIKSFDAGSEPLHVGVDFNIGNMAAVIKVRTPDKLIVIDEMAVATPTSSAKKSTDVIPTVSHMPTLTHQAEIEARTPQNRHRILQLRIQQSIKDQSSRS